MEISDFTFNAKRILILLGVIYLAYIFSGLIFQVSQQELYKYLVAVILFLLLIKFIHSISIENVIAFMILIIPFPIIINFGGKDLGSSITVIIYLIFISYILGIIIRKEIILPDRPLLKVVLFILVCYVVSFSNTPWQGRENAVRKFSEFVSCIIIFYLVINSITNKRAIFKIVDMITIICFIQAIIVLFQALFPSAAGFLNFFAGKGTDVGRSYRKMEDLRILGTITFDYELLSEYFSMNILMQLVLLRNLKRSFKKTSYIICLIFSSVALIATGSRGGVVSLIVGFIIISLLAKKQLKLSTSFIIFCSAGMLLLGVMLIFSAYMPYVANVFDRFTETKYEGLVPDTRVIVWKTSWPMIMQNPWIGHGPQSVAKSGLKIFVDPHSTYLYYLFNIGIVGTSGVILFFSRIFWIGYTAIKKQYDYEITYLLVALVGSFLVFIINEYKISYLRDSSIQQFVWLIFALIVAASQIAKKSCNDKITSL
jgi:O-antigen ligase